MKLAGRAPGTPFATGWPPATQPGQPPSVSLLSHGYQYLTEQRYDQMEPVLAIVRGEDASGPPDEPA